jgi:hypothetical protein
LALTFLLFVTVTRLLFLRAEPALPIRADFLFVFMLFYPRHVFARKRSGQFGLLGAG